MTISVKRPLNLEPDPDVQIEHTDMLLIKRIRNEIGLIEAIKVTRWLTKASLKESKQFVDSLSDEHPKVQT